MTTSMTAKSAAMTAAALFVVMAHPVAALGMCASPTVAACIADAARAQCGAGGCSYFADASNQCEVRVCDGFRTPAQH